MFEIIVGNVCSIGAMICDSISATRKNNKEILIAQSISQIFYFSASFILKGYSACVQNAISILRNLFAIKEWKSKVIEVILIILPVVLGFYFNNRGWLGVLPIVANLGYSISISVFKNNPVGLKIAFTIDMIMFAIFNFFIYNYVACVTNIATIIMTIIAIVKAIKTNKEKDSTISQ